MEPPFYDSKEEYERNWIMADDVLNEIRSLKEKLYGANGYEGDITEIKKDMKIITELVQTNRDRSIKNKWMIYTIIGLGLGGGSVGFSKLIEALSRIY